MEAKANLREEVRMTEISGTGPCGHASESLVSLFTCEAANRTRQRTGVPLSATISSQKSPAPSQKEMRVAQTRKKEAATPDS